MQLKKIKLSGFKSFVDPVTVPVDSRLVAIVGPNGCGKSNVIDAVCWVMGESSAKYLRGESLTDVIFNGSANRKPVGQASVELIFDNQDGTIGGEYAGFAEISIRRVLNRNGDSGWFLNGTRCRRRDIVDIFLGTGLGPRSYSIIGQNMISRIIEARPEDMRTYLEEAAGVSRYRERRRETETRIQHARENMARLEDIRTELGRQLGTLQRQAETAEKFKALKREERTLRAAFLASQWRQLDTRRVQYALQVQQQETGLEAKQMEVGELTLLLDQARENGVQAAEVFQEIQKRHYVAGNQITRIEQDILHTRERERLRREEDAQAAKEKQFAESKIAEARDQLVQLTQAMTTLQPHLSEAKTQNESTKISAKQAEEAMQRARDAAQTLEKQMATANETARTSQVKLAQLEERLLGLTKRQALLSVEQDEKGLQQVNETLQQLVLQINECEQRKTNEQSVLESIHQKISALRQEQQEKARELDRLRSGLQQFRGQVASLEALQQTALGQRNNQLARWLAAHQLDSAPRLAEGLSVTAGWETAVEKVLGVYLQAICTDDVSVFLHDTSQLPEGSLCVFSGNKAVVHAKENKNPAQQMQHRKLLRDQITSTWPLDSLLAGVYIAETMEEATDIATQLQPHESVVTRDGIWLGAAWLRLLREDNPAAGIFQRATELKELAGRIQQEESALKLVETALLTARQQQTTLEKERDALQLTLNQINSELAGLRAAEKMQQARLVEIQKKIAREAQEKTDVENQINQVQQESESIRQHWSNAMQLLDELTIKRDGLVAERDQLQEAARAARLAAETAREKVHTLELDAQRLHSEEVAKKQALQHFEAQLAACVQRETALQKEAVMMVPLAGLESDLAIALNHRLQVEEELNAARASMDAINQELRTLEESRHRAEGETAKIRDVLETLRVESEGLRIRAESMVTQLTEIQIRLEDILGELPEEATPDAYHQQLEQVTRRIARLGAINLVAIEEYATCNERKQYLDRQHADLQAGLTTLENAIAKIDRETRARFRETFDRVNARFAEVFPAIFGGGKAWLELTGDNLLEAGVTVMACPPGKRNSTIHLLSGGEKAMTAIALVFSIFHLNPAPFCLLDEVDAPLDDANIGRFCELVKSMSQKTQFIFISHNKLAIEMGETLMGVTMAEPGVSRLVSVNVEEAVHLAGA